MKIAIQRWYFQSYQVKPYHWKNPKTLKLYPQTWYLNENFLIMMIYYITLERSWKMLFNDNMFKNFNWNNTIHKPQEPETIPSNLVCQWKTLNNSGVLYIIRQVIKCRIKWKYFRKRQLILKLDETMFFVVFLLVIFSIVLTTIYSSSIFSLTRMKTSSRKLLVNFWKSWKD